jgi:hypothetical protein
LATHQWVAGAGANAGYTDVWFGKGNHVVAQGGTIAEWTLHGEESAGSTNSAGGTLNIAGGRGTGNAAAGLVNIQVSTVGASGSTLQTLATRLAVSAAAITAQNGAVFVGNLTGNVTGNLTGNVTGNVTGNLTGNVTGDVTGNLTGNVNASTVSVSSLLSITGNGGVMLRNSALDEVSVQNNNNTALGSLVALNLTATGTITAPATNFGITINYLDHASVPQTISF